MWPTIDKLIILPAGLIMYGIALTYIHYKRNTKKFIWSAVMTILILVGVIVYTIVRIYALHTEEIKIVIRQRGGTVTAIQRIRAEKSPIGSSGAGNTTYKINYEIDGMPKIAWYRGINALPDIHTSGHRSKEEKWIFE